MPQIKALPKEEEIHNSYNITLYFDKAEDAQTIELLDRIRYGYKNGFVKNVVRSYMYGGYCAYYFDEPQFVQYYFEKMQSMQSGILSYDKFKEIRPDRIPDALLKNTALQIHDKSDEKLEAYSTYQEKEDNIKEKPVEKESTSPKEKTSPVEEPIVFPMDTDEDSGSSSAASSEPPVEEPIIVEMDEKEQQELEDMFASMMTDF